MTSDRFFKETQATGAKHGKQELTYPHKILQQLLN
jgi:hypothetical protein